MLKFLTIATPTPTPGEFDPNLVTPGVIGFVATMFMVVAAIVILIDMNRRTRRVTYRAQIAAQLDAEEAAASDAAQATPEAAPDAK